MQASRKHIFNTSRTSAGRTDIHYLLLAGGSGCGHFAGNSVGALCDITKGELETQITGRTTEAQGGGGLLEPLSRVAPWASGQFTAGPHGG